MDDTNLTAEEERQLREVVSKAPDNLKQDFCNCWPAVKKMLEWLSGKLGSAILKYVVKLIISLGDGIYKVLGCKAAEAERR